MNEPVGTFDLDKTLQPLPVPRLAETCERYLASVEPLVEPDVFQRIKTQLTELQAPGGVGERLQNALEMRAANMDNWLFDWWAHSAYLDWPDSLVCNSSIGISSDARYAPGDQAMRAAQVTAQTLDFYLSIVNETMPPELMRDGSALDMSLMRNFFSTNRYPGADGDRMQTFPAHESRHIIVIRRGRLYSLDVIDEEGTALAPAQLMAAYQSIIAAADSAGAAAPIGVLTAARRPDWAKARQVLAQNPQNENNLNRVDRAAFVVCLDAQSHDNLDKLAHAGLHGQAGDRWHDKSLHMVIDADGRFTLHGEHTPVDAGAWVPLVDLVSTPAEPVTPASAAEHPAPVELEWQLSDETLASIDAAKSHFHELIDNLDLHIRYFDTFGKTTIKTLKTGPDPVLQMAFQLAYWRLHNRSPKVYEAASTRMYRQGRTETIRSTSNQSRAFVMAMDDASTPAANKAELLRAAFAEHNKRVKEASAGHGVDRHMLGLQLIAKELEVTDLPAIFSEPVHKRGWEITSAQLPMRNGLVNHFAPVCPDGYGIGYIIKDDHINMCVTAWKSDPDTGALKYADAISQSLNDIRALLETAG